MLLLSENGQDTVFIEFVFVRVQQCYHLISCKISYWFKSNVILIHCPRTFDLILSSPENPAKTSVIPAKWP